MRQHLTEAVVLCRICNECFYCRAAFICTRSSSSSPQYFFVKRRFFPNWGIAREYL